jgi:hypothetical protein
MSPESGCHRPETITRWRFVAAASFLDRTLILAEYVLISSSSMDRAKTLKNKMS